ncbi:MAG TPA: choice-of-anchor L domain-containing protein [Phenylobacterium sp.]|nr:choice-of-anchor L domain-containing protein [Phenylobacterium sp.]
MPVFTAVDQNLVVSDPASVIGAFFPASAGITVDTASLLAIHSADSISFYDGSVSALGIGPGLLMTSGTIPNLTNTAPDFGVDNAMVGDPDLDAVVSSVFATTSYDASTLSFNFTVTDPAITGISFKVVFGTDEYPEWVDAFVDIGVVMVNGTNVAYFGNDPTAPLSVIGSNLSSGYFIDNTDGHLPTEYDGISNVLTVFAPVQQGLNTLKIGIADTGDHILDSGIFISGLTATSIPVSGVSLDVTCTSGDDLKTGTSASENIYALAGNDSVNGAGGDDVISGGLGDDDLAGGAGDDFLDGGDGQDIAIFSGQMSDYAIMHLADGGYQLKDLRAGAPDGSDSVHNIEAVQFADGVFVTAGLVTGGSEIYGSGHDDTISAVAAPPGQPLTTDQADAIWGYGGDDKITSGGGDDVIHDGSENDIVDAGAGDDIIYVEGGNDEINGGAGADTVVLSGADTDYSVVVGGDGFKVTDLRAGAPDGLTQIANVEKLAFSNKTVDLTGGGVANAAPKIAGGDLTGQVTEPGTPAGVISLTGAIAFTDANAGDTHTVSVVAASGDATGVTFVPTVAGEPTSSAPGQVGWTLNVDSATIDSMAAGQVRNLAYTVRINDSAGAQVDQVVNFTITGTNDAPTLATPLADASLTAGSTFTYSLAAGTFADVDGDALTLKATLADGSALPSWLVFDAATGGFSGTPQASGALDVKVTATDAGGLAASDVMTFTIGAQPGQSLTGGAGADALTGGATDDVLSGLAGNDTLQGGGGNDVLEGGAGNDVLNGGAGVDTASYAGATAGVTVSLAVTKAQDTGGAGKDTLSNLENLQGSGFADRLTGDAKANLLEGGAGNDTLVGGDGSDGLSGGAGADRFLFVGLTNSTPGARDAIYNFSHADGDRIDLSGIDAVAGGKDQAFSLVGAFSNKAGQLISVIEADHYAVQGDVNGDGVADFVINVYSQTTLTASDFVL